MEPSGSSEPSLQEKCRAIFEGNEKNPKLADMLAQHQQDCVCEGCTVGSTSPGPVASDEHLHRIIISPRDVDEEGYVAAAPFEKVFSSGLSVVRSVASIEDVERLVTDGLWTKSEQPLGSVKLILTASVAEIREKRAEGGRPFCVYDQTVPRRFEAGEQVPTHAGVFLRLPPPGTDDRKKLQKDFARELRDIFLKDVRNSADVFDGLLIMLSERALKGEFIIVE